MTLRSNRKKQKKQSMLKTQVDERCMNSNQLSIKTTCVKTKATKSRSVTHRYSSDDDCWTFQKATCHLSFWIKWKHFRTRFSENMISTNCAYTQNSILRKAVKYIQLIIQEVEPKWFQNSEEEQATQYSQNCKPSKRLENKKLLMSQKNNKDHKIWVDVQVEQNRLLQAMVDSEAINNYILQQAIRMLELTLQWALKPMQIYMVNGEFWVNNRPGSHEAIILEDSQSWRLMFQFNQVWRHTRMPWLRKELKNWLNQQRIIHHSRCVWDSQTTRNELIRA
jgi:hypothetical protein